jgi:hypothetical protein
MKPVEEWRAPELRLRGLPFGLSAEQVAAADLLGMSLSSYAAYARVIRNVDDQRQHEAEERARARAREELAFERAKAEVAAGGAS